MAPDTPEDRARDARNIQRHAKLVEHYKDQSAETVLQDIYFLSQIALFKMYQERKG